MRARAEDLCNLALDQLTRPGLLHLVADGDLASGPQQPAEVRIGRVKRNAAHWHHASFSERHVEQLRAYLRILEKHLVKITEPKQEQRVLGQLALDAAILRHHRGELGVAGHRRNVSAESRAGRN